MKTTNTMSSNKQKNVLQRLHSHLSKTQRKRSRMRILQKWKCLNRMKTQWKERKGGECKRMSRLGGVWGRGFDDGGGVSMKGAGYLSAFWAPGSIRVFNSTPRAGLGFLRTANTISSAPRVTGLTSNAPPALPQRTRLLPQRSKRLVGNMTRLSEMLGSDWSVATFRGQLLADNDVNSSAV